MATEAFVQVATDGTGKKIRNVSFTGIGGDGDPRHLQAIILGDPETVANLARILGADPNLSDAGLVTRPIPYEASTATVTSVVADAADTQLLAGNVNRLGALVHNDADKDVRIKLGTGASATSFTTKVGPQQTWALPAGLRYTGAIHGIWDAGVAGNARVTEVTP